MWAGGAGRESRCRGVDDEIVCNLIYETRRLRRYGPLARVPAFFPSTQAARKLALSSHLDIRAACEPFPSSSLCKTADEVLIRSPPRNRPEASRPILDRYLKERNSSVEFKQSRSHSPPESILNYNSIMGKTALVLLDYQVGILNHFSEPTKLLGRVSAAARAARAANHPVIYVTVELRAGHPEISPFNFSAKRVKATGGFVQGDPSVAVHPDVAPQEGDISVVKRRVSAFQGSDFDAVLRGLQVDALVLAGVATSGAVLSTLRQAVNKHYMPL
ncbi:Isochorismatase-like protein [Mycena albidolilacea]|uniref:Isochorismatase-like protein n=1 Tax=Mycena albidolilacea TaxID=1033008 RepID=A0AAD7F3I2_9AGAR|nr:Isochorismatase-like protein [Mycena albidolilacea]